MSAKTELLLAGVNTSAQEIHDAAIRGAQKRINGMKTAAGTVKVPVQADAEFFKSQGLKPKFKLVVEVIELDGTEKAAK